MTKYRAIQASIFISFPVISAFVVSGADDSAYDSANKFICLQSGESGDFGHQMLATLIQCNASDMSSNQSK